MNLEPESGLSQKRRRPVTIEEEVKETLLVAREGRVWCLEDRLVLGGFDWDPTLQEKACWSRRPFDRKEELFKAADKNGDDAVSMDELAELLAFQQENEPLINCCPVCGEILEVSDKLNTLVHLSLCFDEGTGNQVMTGGFLTDKQASYGCELPQCQLYELSSSVVSPILMVALLYVSVEMEFCIHIFDEVFGFYCLTNFLLPFEQPYMEVASSYRSEKVSELQTYIQTNRGEDNNLRLVKQVISSMYKRNIQRLTQTYLTLSLQDIAKIVQLSSPKEAEMHVLQMVVSYAIILDAKKDGMVRFLEDAEQYKNCEMIEHIDSLIQRIMTLSKKLTAVDELLSCDPLYLAKAGRER
ncbi:hypothetical protein NC653_038023 [Populus alba x Populus x berolinensis]|uniref:PCI domain-containing protein n=1 Tax=Populus alba x Populus x berolinensis TaxID=444605 RepID=A0AAD6LFN6_9ROSI|nr:hypothetical protein NC653_038023 [Populus alba x Populus x berolinensis]